jgi:hypothetical protein
MRAVLTAPAAVAAVAVPILLSSRAVAALQAS